MQVPAEAFHTPQSSSVATPLLAIRFVRALQAGIWLVSFNRSILRFACGEQGVSLRTDPWCASSRWQGYHVPNLIALIRPQALRFWFGSARIRRQDQSASGITFAKLQPLNSFILPSVKQVLNQFVVPYPVFQCCPFDGMRSQSYVFVVLRALLLRPTFPASLRLFVVAHVFNRLLFPNQPVSSWHLPSAS